MSDTNHLAGLINQFFAQRKINAVCTPENLFYLVLEQDCNDPPNPPHWYHPLILFLYHNGIDVEEEFL